MKHCQTCFMLVRTADGICPRCGEGSAWRHGDPAPAGPPVLPEPMPDTREEPEAPPRPRSRREMQLESAVRITQYMLVFVVLATIGVFGLRSLADLNRAAQASWNAQAQLGKQKFVRSEDLKLAVQSLKSIHQALRDRAARGAPTPEDAEWRRQWREELARTRDRYRLTGQPGFSGHLHPAEEPLRDATLYLTSLEREWGERGELSASLTAALEQSLEDAGRHLD